MAISEEVVTPQVSVKLEFPSMSDQVIIHTRITSCVIYESYFDIFSRRKGDDDDEDVGRTGDV